MSDRCARCRGEFYPVDRKVADPCCSAPDCENVNDYSHYGCLPRKLQELEDEDYYDATHDFWVY